MAKILEARQRGILRVLNKAAVDNKKKPLPPHLARAFQHSTRIEEGNRLFLEAMFHRLVVLECDRMLLYHGAFGRLVYKTWMCMWAIFRSFHLGSQLLECLSC